MTKKKILPLSEYEKNCDSSHTPPPLPHVKYFVHAQPCTRLYFPTRQPTRQPTHTKNLRSRTRPTLLFSSSSPLTPPLRLPSTHRTATAAAAVQCCPRCRCLAVMGQLARAARANEIRPRDGYSTSDNQREKWRLRREGELAAKLPEPLNHRARELETIISGACVGHVTLRGYSSDVVQTVNIRNTVVPSGRNRQVP